VFTTNAELGRFGPGHNSFVKAEDGVTDLMIYHSRDYKELKGSPLTDPNRHARARIITWDKNGFPVFSPELAD
jgi:GH43 family beta-xylosidase